MSFIEVIPEHELESILHMILLERERVIDEYNRKLHRYSPKLVVECENKHRTIIAYFEMKEDGTLKQHEKSIFSKRRRRKTEYNPVKIKIYNQVFDVEIPKVCPRCKSPNLNLRFIEYPKDLCLEILEAKEKIKKYESLIEMYIKDYDLYKYYLKYIKGLGIIGSAWLIWLFLKLNPQYPTKVYAYCGLYPVGYCEKCGYVVVRGFRVGMKCPKCGNELVGKLPTKKLASQLGITFKVNYQLMKRFRVIVDSLNVANGVYGRIFKKLRERDKMEGKKTAWVKTAKLLISHAWEVWYYLKYNEVPPKPYQFAYLLHDTYIPPLVDKFNERNTILISLIRARGFTIEEYLDMIENIEKYI